MHFEKVVKTKIHFNRLFASGSGCFLLFFLEILLKRFSNKSCKEKLPLFTHLIHRGSLLTNYPIRVVK